MVRVFGVFDLVSIWIRGSQSVGPLLGGALTVAFNWRATFWLLAVLSGILTLAFLFLFNDTFRRERSLIYQSVLKQRLRVVSMRSSSVESNSSMSGRTSRTGSEIADLEKRGPPAPALPAIELSLRDVNPFKPIIIILRRWNNVVILIATGKSSLNAPGVLLPIDVMSS